jgi:hypothetical protein
MSGSKLPVRPTTVNLWCNIGILDIMYSGLMHFRNSNLAATDMAKHTCNTAVNKMKVLVINSDFDSGKLKLNDSDTECTHDLPE